MIPIGPSPRNTWRVSSSAADLTRPDLPALRRAGVPVVWVNWGSRPDRLNLSPALLHVYNGSGAGTGLGDALPATGSPVLQAGS